MGVPVIRTGFHSDAINVVATPEDAARGLRNGDYILPRDTQVPVRLADGSIGRVNSRDALDVINTGGTLMGQEEYRRHKVPNQGDQMVQTGAEGLARGALMGLSDVAFGAISGDMYNYLEEAQARRETNPRIAATTEIVGAIAPMLIPGAGEANAARIAGETAVGGTVAAGRIAEAAASAGQAARAARSAVYSAGRLLPARGVGVVGDAAATGARLVAEAIPGLGSGTGTVARMARAGIEQAGRGVAEGALMGAGQQITEMSLDRDPDNSAEHILANIGMGSLLGGVGGATLGAGFTGLGRAVEALTPSAEKIAKFRLSAAGITGEEALASLIARPSVGSLIDAAQVLEERGVGLGAGGRSLVPSAGAAVTDATSMLENSRAALNRIEGEAVQSVQAFDARFREAERRALDELTQGSGMFDDAMLREAHDTAIERTFGAWPEGVPRDLTTPGTVVVDPIISEVNRLAKEIRVSPSGGPIAARLEAMVRDLSPDLLAVPSGLPFERAIALAKQWDTRIRPQAGEVNILRSNDTLRIIRNLLRNQIDEAAERAGVGPAWARAQLERGVSEAVIEAGAKAPPKQTLAESLGSVMAGGAAGVAGLTALTTGALSHGLVAGLESVASHGFIPGGVAGYGLMKGVPALRARIPGTLSTAYEILSRVNSDSASRAVQAARGILSQTKRVAPASTRVILRRELLNNYNAEVRRLRNSTPQALTRQLAGATASIGEVSVPVQQAMIQSAIRATAFLEGNIPESDQPIPDDLQPHLNAGTNVSEADQAHFMALSRAVHNPGEILDSISDGSLSTEQAQVLHDVYPSLLAEVKGHVMDALANSTEPIPYETRLRLGILLGTVTSPTLDPSFINSMQASLETAPPPEQPRTLDSRGLDRISNTVALNSSFSDSLSARQFRT